MISLKEHRRVIIFLKYNIAHGDLKQLFNIDVKTEAGAESVSNGETGYMQLFQQITIPLTIYHLT